MDSRTSVTWQSIGELILVERGRETQNFIHQTFIPAHRENYAHCEMERKVSLNLTNHLKVYFKLTLLSLKFSFNVP